MGTLLGASVQAATAVNTKISLRQAPDEAPNIVVVLLDDVGFGATATFGGPVNTPALATLADEGLRFNRFHTTAICSPTRASLLTGRDSHAANVGAVMNSASSLPGYQGILRQDTATVAEILRLQGYSTGAFGKWHLTPAWESTTAGPFDHWPTGVGFDRFYGFLGGETDQFEPTLYEGTTPVHRPAGENYHLTEDLVDHAIQWIRSIRSIKPGNPFFLYLAPGATHAPLQVADEWIERYRGAFDDGWDVMRTATLERQQALGIAPEDTVLTPRPSELPAWDSLSEEQRQVAVRLMETYAGFLEHTDVQIGRLVHALKSSGDFDNTLFVYIAGDNGSSAEGGLAGSINYMGSLQGIPETLEQQLAALDSIGSKTTYPQYPAGWAWALTSPFQWVKQVASHLGGTRVGTVISWPKTIGDQAGGLRNQFAHVNDITPTILDATGISMPEIVNGAAQRPMDGSSLLASLQSSGAPEHHRMQLFEVNGNRSLYHDGWIASAFHQRLPWSVGVRQKSSPMEEDRWELYDLREDYSQSRNLASEYPEKLAELQALFHQEAERLGILPLRSAMDTMKSHPVPDLRGDRTEFTFYAGTIGISESQAPFIFNRSWSLQALLRGDQPRGVVATMGGTVGGWSLFFDESGRPTFHYRSFERGEVTLRGKQAIQGASQIDLHFAYDGGGYARGGVFTLVVNGVEVDQGRIAVTPPAYFSIDETFDIGIDTGSPAGRYPEQSPLGYPFEGGQLDAVKIRLQ
ncbi:arylsulfatase [Seongchinamella sediminis]|uniref:Arylsulfatase n=2 Tax=Seongchinamella sediminis TaxID=2283635 RepID=A0A3L7DSE5_9GAMM|nr:arylsulfatase [Seongchinamella sediminis]